MVILTMLYFSLKSKAQDIESFKDAKLLKASGGVALNTMYTQSTDTTNKRDPFFWQFQANLNLNILGIIDAPFSLVLNSQKSTVNQPALPTQFGISPKYKAVTAHLGYRSLRFSDYTLGGLMFLGIGVEVAPENHWLSGAVMYGRFSQALQPVLGVGLGKFERRGYGLKLRAGDDKKHITLVGFRAKDDPTSISDPSLLSEDLPPQENVVWAVMGSRQFGKLTVDAEYTTSAITRDSRNQDVVLNDFSYYNNLGRLFTPNATTSIRSAFVLKNTLALSNYNLNFMYKRVAPDFASLGATSLNDDLEEISGGVSFQLLDGNISIDTNAGVQRNNLDQKSAEGLRKLISSFNIFWLATDRLNFNANYSNFNSNTVRTANILSDTLEFFQVTNNAALTTTYQITSNNPQSIVLNANYQEAFDSENNANDGVNANLAYSISIPASKISGSLSYNYNVLASNGMVVVTTGPTLSVAKPIKDFNLSLALSSLSSQVDNTPQNAITNVNFATRYTWKKKHGFAMTYMMLNRASKIENIASVAENRVNFNYSYRF